PKVGDAKQFPIYSGYVVATPSREDSPAVHVPYIGLKGKVRDVPIMDSDLGLPMAGVRKENGDIEEIPKDFVFNFKDAAPAVVVRFASHTPNFTIRIHDAKTDKFLGYVVSGSDIALGATGRMTNLNDGKYSSATFSWRGLVLQTADLTSKPVQLGAGSYKIFVASQRKLTKGAYPADYEIFDMGIFNVSA
ncbi:hypothetical protein BGZ90_008629, partial [Linnemannia elongata]